MESCLQQRMTFCSLYITYLLYIYCRRSVTNVLPEIVRTENLDENNMGVILSSQMLAYAISKFISGIMMDFISPKVALSLGLIGAATTVLLFASVNVSVWVMTCLWFVNGLTLGPGWPSAALIMKKWFRKDQFGTAWSLLSTSMNVAGTLGPLLAAYFVTVSGWRASFYLPGMVALGVGVVILYVVKDSPDTPVEDEQLTDKKTDAKTTTTSESKTTISRLELFLVPGYLGVCITYGIISTVQYGTFQWGPVYLVNDIGHSIVTGNSYVSSLEVGGIVGSVFAGYYSDYLLTKNPSIANHIIRQYVIAWFTCGLVVFLYILTYCITIQSSTIWINIVGFCLGMTIYGPISIFGVVAIETAPSHMSGSAHAIVCLFANGGQTFAGWPLGYIAQHWGWQTSFLLQIILVILMVVYLFIYTTIAKNQASVVKKKS